MGRSHHGRPEWQVAAAASRGGQGERAPAPRGRLGVGQPGPGPNLWLEAGPADHRHQDRAHGLRR
eukprot:7687785-Pyramimonas_sp.AAC.1